MTNFKLGRWLLVALAIVGLAFAAPVASAHGNDTTADDTLPDNTTADEWPTWMEAQMTEHMGPDSVEWMESHMGVTVDEMTQDMADEEYHDEADDDYNGDMYGQSHC
jgi:hypothetical protein